MLVYADNSRSLDVRAHLSAIAESWAEVWTAPAGLERHSRLVARFIATAELAQGIADAELATFRVDRFSPAQSAAMALLVGMSAVVDHSWQNGYRLPAADPIGPLLAGLSASELPECARCKWLEGFAFYAVYPEGYLRAARDLLALGKVRVIGIRSIGIALAALVAHAAGADKAVTVRPIGRPNARNLAISENLALQIVGEPADAYAIADEGPGLSGSSFGCVADFLEDAGIAPTSIHFFPSHLGDLGPGANARHRARWRASNRHVVDFDALMLGNRPRLAEWLSDFTQSNACLEDVSSGRWRAYRYVGGEDWPPAHLQQERRKFLVRDRAGQRLIAKFAGLGHYGERKLARARALGEAGFVPPVLGLRYGFLVEQWIEPAQVFSPVAITREYLLARVARYLAFRAEHFVVDRDRGASAAELAIMLRENVREGLGEPAAAAFDDVAAELRRLAPRMIRVATDNRLHAWEWQLLPGGELLKCDALDHCEAHDLIGCQDIAWDVVGAGVELNLDEAEQDDLCERIERICGRPVEHQLLRLLRPCYLAFQLGYYSMAAATLAETPGEAARLEARSRIYAASLEMAAATL